VVQGAARTRRLCGSWTEFFEYFVFISVCTAGIFDASRMWVPIGAMVLFLLGWPQWRELFVKGEKIDAQYREHDKLAWERRVYEYVLRICGSAYRLPLVVGGKVGAISTSGAFFLFGHDAWIWGVE
jgi:hypothetical protein